MRLNRFYTERKNIREGSSVKLPDSDNKHIKKVLRLSKGDEIIVFNGEKEFIAELKIVSNEVTMVRLKKQIRDEMSNNNSNVHLTLFQGLLRAGKFDDILVKTTELGVDAIVPMECEFSQSKKFHAGKKIERWEKILISASKQSERISIPDLIEPMTFIESMEHLQEFDKIFFFTTKQQGAISLNVKSDVEVKSEKVAIFIGPEGGFSPTEHNIAIQSGLEFYSLGKTILRSETASIFATGLIKFLHG